MEEYQFGKHLAFEEVLKNKEYYAQIFSEDNDDLYKILMYCFNNNIETYMCCAGHEEGDAPFIILYIPYNNRNLIYSVVSAVYNIDNVIIRLGKQYGKDAIQVDIRSYCNDYFLKNVYNGLSDVSNAKSVKPDTVNVVEILNKFTYPSYDLYIESNRIDCCRNSYQMWANYIYTIDGQRRRQLYALDAQYDYKNLINITECFDEKTLNEKANEINNDEMILQKTMKHINK